MVDRADVAIPIHGKTPGEHTPKAQGGRQRPWSQATATHPPCCSDALGSAISRSGWSGAIPVALFLTQHRGLVKNNDRAKSA